VVIQIDATKIIRWEFPHIRTIGLSMYDDAETEGGMRDAGAVAFPNKGSHSDALVNAIRGRVFAISDKTKILVPLEPYKSNIMEKLRGYSLADLTELAIRKKLIEP
jgi:hypothetical protein